MQNSPDSNTSKSTNNERTMALVMLLFMPLFFSTNIIFGRAAVQEIGPFTLATLRWFGTAMILLPFVWPVLSKQRASIFASLGLLFQLGFFGMWICGAIVYVALTNTTATNGTLIYTASPVLVILIEWLFRGRQTSWREAIGIVIACFGVSTIIFKGSLSNLVSLSFNIGDLLFVITAVSWAFYSVMMKTERVQHLQTFPLFALAAITGTILLIPFSAFEIATSDALPSTQRGWMYVLGIVFLSSLVAFSAYQTGIRILGASTTSIYLYLLPVYGVALAIWLLDEKLELFHIGGITLVLGGVILATFPHKFRSQAKA